MSVVSYKRRPVRRAPRLSPEQQRYRRDLARTLERASEIASLKAEHSRRSAVQVVRRKRRYTYAGVALLVLGVVGSFVASFNGLADLLGIFFTTAMGMLSVVLGALILSLDPASPEPLQNSYAKNARGLAQLSRSLKSL